MPVDGRRVDVRSRTRPLIPRRLSNCSACTRTSSTGAAGTAGDDRRRARVASRSLTTWGGAPAFEHAERRRKAIEVRAPVLQAVCDNCSQIIPGPAPHRSSRTAASSTAISATVGDVLDDHQQTSPSLVEFDVIDSRGNVRLVSDRDIRVLPLDSLLSNGLSKQLLKDGDSFVRAHGDPIAEKLCEQNIDRHQSM